MSANKVMSKQNRKQNRVHPQEPVSWFLSWVLRAIWTFKWQGHSRQRKHQHGEEEYRAKTGLGDIRLGYKCCLSLFSAGLPTTSCCSHLFSCFAVSLHSSLLHSPSPSSTSSPHVQNTWVWEISPERAARWWEGVRCLSFREGEGHRSEEHPGLQPRDHLLSPWNLSCCSMANTMLCQMILTDSMLCADSKEKHKADCQVL